MPSEKLRLQNIGHSFGNDKTTPPLFDDLNLSINEGEVVAIVGTSGVGKTTLFNIAAGLITPKSGSVWIDSINRTAKSGFAGYMLQKDLLLPFKSIYDNIALPLVLKKQSTQNIRAIIEPLLPAFGLAGLEHQFPNALSGCQRQRAALLRTYLSNNELMLLDEPFSALDYATKNAMYAWFNDFRKQHRLTCLIITHDIDEAIQLSNRVYVLSGLPATLSANFSIPKHAEFLQSQAYLSLKQEILNSLFPSM